MKYKNFFDDKIFLILNIIIFLINYNKKNYIFNLNKIYI